MSEQANPNPSEPKEKPILAQHYVKSHFFRVVHVDGMFGGPTFTTDNLHIGIFSERAPFPEHTFYNLEENIEETAQRVGKQGIERELEVSLVMNLRVAKSFRTWLDNAINIAERAAKKGGEGPPEETKT